MSSVVGHSNNPHYMRCAQRRGDVVVMPSTESKSAAIFAIKAKAQRSLEAPRSDVARERAMVARDTTVEGGDLDHGGVAAVLPTVTSV
jgi:hypothetical protein